MIAIGIALGFATLYFLLQAYYFFNWHRTPAVRVPEAYRFTEKATIVIVARNEANQIGKCLDGLLHQKYPAGLIEIIVVDDHSSDHTAEIVKTFGNSLVQLYRLQDFPAYIKAPAFKKSGITLAVDQSKTEYILVTDADCVHAETWVSTMMYALKESNAVFETAPVLLHQGDSLLAKMQEMEQLVLMLITGAGITSRLHDMANGANMAFRKSAFLAVNGYDGNTAYASGDDMFLIEKMRGAFSEKISFVKSNEAAIITEGKMDWASLFKQRIRWAGKNAGLENKTISRIWVFVGIYHAAMILALLAALFQIISAWPFIMLLSVKWTIDYIMIATASAFFQRTALLKYFVPLQFLYAYYLIRLGMLLMMGRKGDWERD